MKAAVKLHKGKAILVYRTPQGKPCAKPYTMKAAKSLSRRGYTVGSLEAAYNYPGPYSEPRDCQRSMVKIGLRYKRFFNLSEMRTGKTSGTLWLLDILMRYKGLETTLVVAPLGTILSTWKAEIYQTIPHLSVYFATKNVKSLLDAIKSKKYSMIVVNPGKLQKAIGALLWWDPDYVVVDEVMEFKNPDTSQYTALETLMTGEKGRKRGFIPLSGTLGSQSLTDVWTSARFINPETPRHFGKFKEQVLYQPDARHKPYLWEPVEDAEEYVASLLTPSVRFRTDDVNDMPKHEGFSEMVDMSPVQKRMFKEMLNEQITENEGKTVTASHAAVKLWKLLQIASGVVYSETGEHVVCGAPEKIAAVKRLARETPKKTVIFSGWDCQQQYLVQQLKGEFKTDVINGSVPVKERAVKEKEFQEGDTDILICHPRTTKHGIKLHAGSLVIWFGPRTSTEEFVQGSARVRGPGTGATYWCELSSCKLDKDWFDIVKGRNNRKNRVLDLYREVLEEFS